jgi:hypothetical protein
MTWKLIRCDLKATFLGPTFLIFVINLPLHHPMKNRGLFHRFSTSVLDISFAFFPKNKFSGFNWLGKLVRPRAKKKRKMPASFGKGTLNAWPSHHLL